MILEKPPSTLIRDAIDNFKIPPDKEAVARVSESLATLQQARDLRAREATAAFRRTTRRLAAHQAQLDELVAAGPDAAEHASEIARLDTLKFRVAKTVSDLEMETERLQARAAELAETLQELELDGRVPSGSGSGSGEEGGVGGGEGMVDDEVLLRLKIYRSLGIEIERDEEDGEFTRAVVRNDRKSNVHVISMDRKFSPFFYANYFWQTL